MVRETLGHFDLAALDLLVVENVGNLVCPAEFNVGEDYKVMLLSVTEGEDKPEKYPLMFMESKVLLINKVDLLPYLDVKLDSIKTAAKRVNPGLRVFEISCKTNEGLDAWYEWVKERVREKKQSRS
jgi:hydrogenase nickel incorporation protein HypB